MQQRPEPTVRRCGCRRPPRLRPGGRRRRTPAGIGWLASASPASAQYTHSGYRYVLGYGADLFGIWDRPGRPATRSRPSRGRTRDGGTRGSGSCNLEPNNVPVGAGGSASPAGTSSTQPMGEAGIGSSGSPAPDPSDDQVLQYTHSGSTYLLGYGRTFFGIWQRTDPTRPARAFPARRRRLGGRLASLHRDRDELRRGRHREPRLLVGAPGEPRSQRATGHTPSQRGQAGSTHAGWTQTSRPGRGPRRSEARRTVRPDDPSDANTNPAAAPSPAARAAGDPHTHDSPPATQHRRDAGHRAQQPERRGELERRREERAAGGPPGPRVATGRAGDRPLDRRSPSTSPKPAPAATRSVPASPARVRRRAAHLPEAPRPSTYALESPSVRASRRRRTPTASRPSAQPYAVTPPRSAAADGRPRAASRYAPTPAPAAASIPAHRAALAASTSIRSPRAGNERVTRARAGGREDGHRDRGAGRRQTGGGERGSRRPHARRAAAGARRQPQEPDRQGHRDETRLARPSSRPRSGGSAGPPRSRAHPLAPTGGR